MINRAIELAAVAHQGQVRKGTDVPYIAHPYAVGMMLAQAGCDQEVVAAGILHDTVEDTDITLDTLREEFGERVAAIVEGCTEPDRSATWEARKRHTLEYLSTASRDVRLVACSDKLHNASSMLSEYRVRDDGLWARFKRGRADQAWYYHGLVEALCSPRLDEPPLPFCHDLRRVVAELFGE